MTYPNRTYLKKPKKNMLKKPITNIWSQKQPKGLTIGIEGKMNFPYQPNIIASAGKLNAQSSENVSPKEICRSALLHKLNVTSPRTQNKSLMKASLSKQKNGSLLRRFIIFSPILKTSPKCTSLFALEIRKF